MLENLTHELTPQPTNLFSGTHDIPLNIAIGKLQNLIHPVLTEATENGSSILPTSPRKEDSTTDNAAFPRVIGTVAPTKVFGRASSRVAEVRGRYNIGTPIIKKFNGILYNGNVVSDNGPWYKIKHEDNDEKKLNHREIIKFVQQANKISLKNG